MATPTEAGMVTPFFNLDRDTNVSGSKEPQQWKLPVFHVEGFQPT